MTEPLVSVAVATMLVLCSACGGCGAAKQPVPKYTPDELLCIAEAERVKLTSLDACKPCSDDQIDAIMDVRKAAGRVCYLGGK